MSETREDPQKSLNNDEDSPTDHTNKLSARDEEAYTAKVDKIVAAERPRMFAVYEDTDDGEEKGDGEELGDDAVVVAWGLSFKDHIEMMIVADDGRQRHFLFSSAEYAARELTARSKHCTLRLVWID